MSINEWKYYNHAALPTTPPHVLPDLSAVKDKSVFNYRFFNGKTAFLARWTEDWDCGKETEWWYIIKDSPFDITKLKAKRRYEINKGLRNFDVKIINPSEYRDEIYLVTEEAYSAWPEKYRPKVCKENINKSIESWKKSILFGGFEKETGALASYAVLTEYDSYVEFSVLRAIPRTERNGINAAMVAGILEYFNDKLEQGIYINDGSRSIFHETAFQDYLEKYFEFRKSYCKLKIAYKGSMGIIIKFLYPFREKIKKETAIGSKIFALLKMEEIRRKCL
ncbi:hypothetical protein [Ruminococcus sp. HUN007]|uniref:hypothetical protein n=1 Tax=Ruminococcus sp. HUN007 TaxID=1514668 RepID=UPI0005D21F05|nr:hypothetical protein [Ruminococcus sp. HUN007]